MDTWHSILSRWIKPWTKVSPLSRIPPKVIALIQGIHLLTKPSYWPACCSFRLHPNSILKLLHHNICP